MFLDYLMLILYALGMVAIALYTRNRSKSVKDFLLAGKKGLNGWMSAFSYGTTYFSAVIFIGYAGSFGWRYGISAIWIGVANALLGGLLAWVIMAKRTKNMTVRLEAKTMPEFFYKRYESQGLRIFSAILVFVFLIPYAASVYNGLGNLFEMVLEIPGNYVIIALAVLTAVYLIFGGYFATSLSDFIQGIIMIVGVIIMFIFFMACSNVNGLEGLKELAEQGFGLFGGFNAEGDNFLKSDILMLVSLILLTSMGVYALPQTVHKYYSVRDAKAVKQGMIITTIFAMLIGVVAYFVGGLSHLFFESASEFGHTDNIIPKMLGDVIPKGLLGLIGVLVLSASMSTLASVSLSSASVISVDLYKGCLKKDAEDKKVTLTMRIMCFAFILISVVIAMLNKKFNITAIAYLMSLSWGTLSGCFFGPFVLGLYNKKLTKAAAYASMIGGLVCTAFFTVLFGVLTAESGAGFGAILKAGVALSPLTGVLCMAISIVITLIVSSFTKQPSTQAVHEAFEREIENEIK